MYVGYPRFSYGRFSFLMVDPWPEFWGEDWYATEDVFASYDEFDGGYYLQGRRYPSIRLAISVLM